MGCYISIKKSLPGFKLDVTLSTQREIIGILGASGAGKSMLLNAISGLVKPDEGQIIINGKTLFDSEKKINLPPKDRKTGFLFQNYALFPHLSIEENIGFGLDHAALDTKKHRVAELMEKFRLTDMKSKYPRQISGGQQQRVALARAMIVEPEILLLDEPFSALDDHLRNHMIREMQEALREYKGTALYVTHNMDEAYRLCNRIAVLKAGKLEAFGQKRELFQNPPTLEAAKIAGCKNLARATRISEDVVEIPEWSLQLKIGETMTEQEAFVGIRANHIRLAEGSEQENCFSVWISDESETPFRRNLYLKIGSPPRGIDDFHIQWEISQDEYQNIIAIPKPFRIYMDPLQVMLIDNKDREVGSFN